MPYCMHLSALLQVLLLVGGTLPSIAQGECQELPQDSVGSGNALLQKSQRRTQQRESLVDPNSPTENFTLSGLHDIVGKDGVLVITLERTPERFQYCAQSLALGGVVATRFPATDAVSAATDAELYHGCTMGYNVTQNSPNCAKPGALISFAGCGKKAEQAIADSHRRALLAASAREGSWTAILEDDMVLVDPVHWDQAFRKAWAKVPPESKIVRLSWCMIMPVQAEDTQIYADAGDFVLSKHVGVTGPGDHGYHPGLCTGGYMVHRDIVPEMLQLFPCCMPLDACYSEYLTRKVGAQGEFHGMEVMINMEARNSRQYIENMTKDHFLGQHGVMYQDRQSLPSVREESSTLYAP